MGIRNKKGSDAIQHDFRSRRSEIGRLALKDLSPAIVNDPKMLKASLDCYVGDNRTIMDVVPMLAKIKNHLPKGLAMYFHCIKDSLTKQEICDFFNEVCVDVPFKLTPDELHEIGTIPYSLGINKNVEGSEAVEHTYYGVFDIDKYEAQVNPKYVPYKKSKPEASTGDIVKNFEKTKSENEELQLNDTTLMIDRDTGSEKFKKSNLEKYFRKDKSVLNKLEDNTDYFIIKSHGDSMDEKSIAELYNNIVDGGGISESDVIKVGIIRSRYPQTNNFEDYTMFAIKV